MLVVYVFFFQTIEGLDGGIKTGDALYAPKNREGSFETRRDEGQNGCFQK